MTTTPQGVDQNEATSTDGAADAFLNGWSDANLLSETDEGAKPPAEDDEITSDEEDAKLTEIPKDDSDDEDLDLDDDEDGDDDEAEDDADQKIVEASDDAIVKITVDGEEQKIAVKDLKRLYGQEASLTRKSQEIATARKKAEDEGARFMASSQKLIDKAQAKLQPYQEIDWMIAQRTLSIAEFTALRQEALAAHEDVTFLTEETNSVMQEFQATKNEDLAVQAQSSLETLQETIPNWSREKYDNIRSFAMERGLQADDVNAIIDPTAISIIHDAMLYRDAKARAVAKKTALGSARTMKKSKAASKGGLGTGKKNVAAAASQLSTSGSKEDAANLFMARWADAADD
jgi:hypothetical protein